MGAFNTVLRWVAHMDLHTFYLLSWTDIDDRSNAEWPYHRVEYNRDRAKELYENYFEQIRYTEEIGFDGVALNEHHYSAYSMDPSPIVVGAHLAAMTDELKLIFLGNVIGIRQNPIRVAEELAVLDTISGGRVIGGMAKGIPKEYLAYNIDNTPLDEGPDRTRDRFEEAVELVIEAWTAEEPFDWDREFFEYENVNIWPKPYQDPRPEIWMPASSEPSFEFAAKHRIGVAVAGPPDEMQDNFEMYCRLAEEEHGWEPTRDKLVLHDRVFVAETTEQARDQAKAHFEYFWDELFGGVQRGTVARAAGDESFDPDEHDLSPYVRDQIEFDFDAAVESGSIAVGTPEEVLAQLESQYEAMGGAGHYMLTVHHGDAPHETTMGSLELFGDEVLPEVKTW